MDRDQKAAAIAELTDELKGSEAIFAVDYRGISVTQASDLRRRLADADAVFKVVKNRLAKLAVVEAGAAEMDDLLVGPTALTMIRGDAVIAAKAISDFAKANDVLVYKGGFMDGEALDPEGFQVIAKLPGVDVLRGQLVGIAASPITSLVRGLGSMVSGLAIALGQIAEQGLVTGEAPPEEETPPAEEEAPAEEAPAEQAEEPVPAEEQPDDASGDQPDADPDGSGGEAEQPAGKSSNDNDAESSEESTPDGEDSEEADSGTTPEED